MARPKPIRSAKNPAPAKASQSPPSKRSLFWPTIIILLLVVLAGWGVVSKVRQGPAIPIPRESSSFRLGVSADELKTTYQRLDLRSYNDDKTFKIATLSAKDSLPAGLESIDLVFFKKKLFFFTQQWLKTDPTRNPEKIAYEYRRWMKPGGGAPQSLGNNTTLREWYFTDGPTEMILRELKYGDQYQFWQDFRDASDPEAKAAFSPYRIDQ